MVIPKVLFQTSRETPSALHTRHMAGWLAPDWTYRHFSDAAVINYLHAHPLAAFPDIVAKYTAMPTGAHKADLFRYYYIYLEGGVFLDWDAKLCQPMARIADGRRFFSVRSSYSPGAIFQGFIGAAARSEIIMAALQDCYDIDVEFLRQHYHQLCMNLTGFIAPHLNGRDVVLFNEAKHGRGVAKVTDPRGDVLALHYFSKKRVPRRVQYFDLLQQRVWGG